METQAAGKKQANGPEKQAAAQPPPQQTPQPQQTQAIAVAEQRQPLTIRDLLEKAKPKLAEVLPKHLSADRLVRVTIACINRTPDLMACTQQSLLNSVMQAAQLGVEPTGVLGSAYLVPFNVKIKGKDGAKDRWEKQAQLIVGYRGLIDLARRSGQIESIEAHIVHENDRFSCHYGLDPRLDHEPCWSGDPGQVKCVYAVAKLKDGGKQIEVMTKTQIDSIMRGSQSKGEWGPWKDHYEEMARKTAVRRIAKYLPLTPELVDALGIEDEAERLAAQDVEVPEAPKGTAGLAAIVKAKQATVEAEHSEDTPHDPVTGEVHEAGHAGVDPPENSERIDPTANADPARAE